MLNKKTFIKLANLGTIIGLGYLTLPVAPVNAQVILDNGPGGGTVFIDVDEFGGFGNGGSTASFFDPIGSIGDAPTTFDSFVALNLDLPFPLTDILLLEEGVPFLSPPTISEQTDTLLISSFTFDDTLDGGTTILDFVLEQELLPLVEGGLRTGSVLRQEYTITNNSGGPLDFDVVRFADPDLQFSLLNGGGCLNCSFGDDLEETILFATAEATNTSDDPTFFGITATGGTVDEDNRFQLDEELSLFTSIVEASSPTGIELENTITGDDFDENSIIDPGGEFDVALALLNEFDLAPGESDIFVTETIFGGIAPAFQPEIEEVELSFSGDLSEDFPFASFSADILYNLNTEDLNPDPDIGVFPIDFFFTEFFDENGIQVATSTFELGDLDPFGNPIPATITIEPFLEPVIPSSSTDEIFTSTSGGRTPPATQTVTIVVEPPEVVTGSSGTSSESLVPSFETTSEFFALEFSFLIEGNTNLPPTADLDTLGEFLGGTTEILIINADEDGFDIVDISGIENPIISPVLITTPTPETTIPEPTTTLAWLSFVGMGWVITKRKIKNNN